MVLSGWTMGAFASHTFRQIVRAVSGIAEINNRSGLLNFVGRKEPPSASRLAFKSAWVEIWLVQLLREDVLFWISNKRQPPLPAARRVESDVEWHLRFKTKLTDRVKSDLHRARVKEPDQHHTDATAKTRGVWSLRISMINEVLKLSESERSQ